MLARRVIFDRVFFFIFSGPTSSHAISQSTGPIFTKFSGLVEVAMPMGGLDKLVIRFAIAQRTLP